MYLGGFLQASLSADPDGLSVAEKALRRENVDEENAQITNPSLLKPPLHVTNISFVYLEDLFKRYPFIQAH